jgi:hypothetical protein
MREKSMFIPLTLTLSERFMPPKGARKPRGRGDLSGGTLEGRLPTGMRHSKGVANRLW